MITPTPQVPFTVSRAKTGFTIVTKWDWSASLTVPFKAISHEDLMKPVADACLASCLNQAHKNKLIALHDADGWFAFTDTVRLYGTWLDTNDQAPVVAFYPIKMTRFKDYKQDKVAQKKKVHEDYWIYMERFIHCWTEKKSWSEAKDELEDRATSEEAQK